MHTEFPGKSTQPGLAPPFEKIVYAPLKNVQSGVIIQMSTPCL